MSTKCYLVVNQEFDTPYVDDKSKVFLNNIDAYNYMMGINMLPENRSRASFNFKPENGYGICYPYGMKEIEFNTGPA